MADNFKFYVLPNNTTGSVLIPVSATIQPIAFLSTTLNNNEAINLRAVIGWVGLSGISNVVYKIWRGAPVTGTLINSSLESSESGLDRNKVTNLAQVDTGSFGTVTYILTAELLDPARGANIIGPLTFTAAKETLL